MVLLSSLLHRMGVGYAEETPYTKICVGKLDLRHPEPTRDAFVELVITDLARCN